MKNSIKVVGTLFIGAAIGATAALLLSPHSGRRNRQLLMKKSQGVSKQVKKAVSDYLSTARRKYNTTVDVYAEKGKRVIDDAQELITA